MLGEEIRITSLPATPEHPRSMEAAIHEPYIVGPRHQDNNQMRQSQDRRDIRGPSHDGTRNENNRGAREPGQRRTDANRATSRAGSETEDPASRTRSEMSSRRRKPPPGNRSWWWSEVDEPADPMCTHWGWRGGRCAPLDPPAALALEGRPAKGSAPRTPRRCA